MPALTLSLAYGQPYDWPALLRFFAARAIPGVPPALADPRMLVEIAVVAAK